MDFDLKTTHTSIPPTNTKPSTSTNPRNPPPHNFIASTSHTPPPLVLNAQASQVAPLNLQPSPHEIPDPIESQWLALMATFSLDDRFRTKLPYIDLDQEVELPPLFLFDEEPLYNTKIKRSMAKKFLNGKAKDYYTMRLKHP